MARAAGAATTVLDSLQALYDSGANPDLTPSELIALLDLIGVEGFSEEQGSYFLIAGTVLRLLLGHAGADVEAMFAATRNDLAELGREIDHVKFDQIVDGLE